MVTFSQFFPWLDFFYGKNKDQSCRGNFCRDRRLRPLVTFLCAVAEVGDKNLSHSPTSAADYFFRLSRQRGLVFFPGCHITSTYLLPTIRQSSSFFFLVSVKKNTKPFLLKFKGPIFKQVLLFLPRLICKHRKGDCWAYSMIK